MSNIGFLSDMQSRKYRPLLWGDCTDCDALSECFEIHMACGPCDSCCDYFLSVHGLVDGHWAKEEV